MNDPLADSILDFIRHRFPGVGEAVSRSTPLLEGGAIDSFGILELVNFLADQCQAEISDEDFLPENFENVDALVKLVERKRT
jgi:acyl carrier protein